MLLSSNLNVFQLLSYSVLGLVLILWFLYLWRNRHKYLFSLKCNGLMALPVIGHAYLAPKTLSDLVYRMHEVTEKYQKFPTCYWFGLDIFITLKKPEHVKYIFNHPNCYEKSFIHIKPLQDITRTGLGAVDYQRWKKLRKVFNPIFNTISVLATIDIFNEHAKIFVKKLNRFIGQGEFDLFSNVACLAIDVLYDGATGMKINTQMNENDHAHVMKRLFQINIERSMKPFYLIDLIFLNSPLGKEHEKLLKELDDFIYEIINKRKQILNERKAALQENKDTKQPFQEAFLDFMFGEYPDTEIRDQITALAFAGSDTSATTVSFFLLSMAVNPDILEKVYAELDDVFGNDKDRDVTSDDLSKLDFLERCIKETLRLFPMTYGVVRYCDQDIEMEGYKIPKNTNFFLLSYNVHRDPEYWPDPLKFNPDRFLPEEAAKRHPYCFQAFSVGPRNCIGLRYSYISLKVYLAHILRHYRFTTKKYKTIEDIKLEWRMIMSPINGFGLQVEHRK